MVALSLIRRLVVPLGLMLAAAAATWYVDAIPPSFGGLWDYGPWAAALLLGLLGLAYGRGRALFVALLVSAGLASPALAAWPGVDAVLMDSVLAAIVVPVNIAILGWLPERGIFNRYGAVRLGLLAVQAGVVVCLFLFQGEMLREAIRFDLVRIDVLPGPLPDMAYAGIAVSLTLLAVLAFRHPSHFNVGLVFAMVVYGADLFMAGDSVMVHALMIAAGLTLCAALLQDGWQMAYRDELTGLPQRRALNEMFLSLGGTYTVAMLDVDHFKQFNDKYGHDIGDDVLKMVAARIARVGAGGKAFRYGGEEFTIVFPSAATVRCLDALEEVRKAVEDYVMVIRKPRPSKGDKRGAERRGSGASKGQTKVSVTVSIGVAERRDRTESAESVIKRADAALYRAKRAGRNRVMPERGRPGANRRAA